MTRLSGVALVTGSTSGIGAAIARSLAEAGMRVALHSRASVSEGRALAAQLPDAIYLRADLADETEARGLVTATLERYGSLDVVVNNAGETAVIPHSDLEAATPEIWRRLYDVNVIGPWTVTTAALPALRASGRGCVVNVTSHAGVRPKGGSIPYAASKAALNHVTRLLAAALGPSVRVNAVAPGLVDTPMTARWESSHQLWQREAPMRRAATPDDVAEVVRALVSSSYLTGEVVVLDGGLNLRR